MSTVANQVQFSFAASSWDVLATAEVLAARPDIDAARIGAQGHSRGGSAVLSAASVHFAAAANAPKLVGVYAAYPWSGQQFLDPAVGSTRIRAIIGDRDHWCSPMQVQAHIHAIRVAGGDATVRIVAGAPHSFDRATPLEHIAHASVTPGAPTLYIADDGAFILPTSDEPDPELVDLERLHVLHQSRLRSPRRQHCRKPRTRAALLRGHDHVLDRRHGVQHDIGPGFCPEPEPRAVSLSPMSGTHPARRQHPDQADPVLSDRGARAASLSSVSGTDPATGAL